MTEKTGIEIDRDASKPNSFSELGVYELSKAVGSRVLDETPPYPFKVSSDGGEVSINGGLGGRLARDGEAVLKTIRALPRSIQDDDEAQRLRSSRAALAEAAARARRSFEEIRASHFLAGTCIACRKFGL